MKSRAVITFFSLGAGIGIFFLVTLFLGRASVPQEFTDSRLKGAELAQKIVALSKDSLQSLEKIAAYDTGGNKAQALILISEQIVKNRENHEEAIKLSSQLERMARLLNDIKPSAARVLATEAVSSEVALVSHLLSYNDNFLLLFETLRDKLEKPTAASNGRVQDLIDRINEEAGAINEFNRRFTQSLAEFDKILMN